MADGTKWREELNFRPFFGILKEIHQLSKVTMRYILKQCGEISTSILLHFDDYLLIIAAIFQEYRSFKFSLNSNLKYLFNTTLSSLKTCQFQPKTDPHSGDHDETKKRTNKHQQHHTHEPCFAVFFYVPHNFSANVEVERVMGGL